MCLKKTKLKFNRRSYLRHIASRVQCFNQQIGIQGFSKTTSSQSIHMSSHSSRNQESKVGIQHVTFFTIAIWIST
jgi:hypothetical protein